jgi:hypothetical protein
VFRNFVDAVGKLIAEPQPYLTRVFLSVVSGRQLFSPAVGLAFQARFVGVGVPAGITND